MFPHKVLVLLEPILAFLAVSAVPLLEDKVYVFRCDHVHKIMLKFTFVQSLQGKVVDYAAELPDYIYRDFRNSRHFFEEEQQFIHLCDQSGTLLRHLVEVDEDHVGHRTQ